MSEETKQRSFRIPAEIDAAVVRMQQSIPDMSYSMAIRRILRAGLSVMDTDTANTQVSMPTDKQSREQMMERMR